MSAAKVILAYPWEKKHEKVAEVIMKKEVAEVAKTELREEATTREQALVQFREWIAKNRDLSNCRMDDNFLLRFLRVKKFSLPMAQQVLLKYLNYRQTFPQMMYNMDAQDPALNDLVSSGYLYVSPFRDSRGRRVIITDASKFDPYKYTSSDMMKCHMMTYETLLSDEDSQVLGFIHVSDVGHVGPAYITLWSPNEFATVIKWGEQSVPMRHKEIHFLNVPTPIQWVYDFGLSRLSPKMKTRFMIHNSMADLHEKVSPNVLPKEYGGSMPLKEMIGLWKKELLAKREELLALDRMSLLSTKDIITRNRNTSVDTTSQSGISSLPGSFRRLQVD